MDKGYKNTINIVPEKRQIEWQKTEFYGLISYGMPVFTGKQYGEGFTPANVFCPEAMDTDLWCMTAKNAGMKTVCVPAKNEKDLYEISEEIKKGLEIVLVEKLDQVLEVAFVK